MRTFKVAVIGTGGFGKSHVKTIMQLVGEGVAECVAFCEIDVERNRESVDQLLAIGAKHYTDYNVMLEERKDLDAVAIATPIHLHKPMCLSAFQKGHNVILEKPPVVTVQDLEELLEAQAASGRLAQVNFQNTSSPSFLKLLEKIRSGDIGDVISVTGIGKWRRTYSYYSRTPWAGKWKIGNHLVLDGTVMNPFAHLLNNCLLAAAAQNPDASPLASVQAELYRAYDNEGDDTSCIRVGLTNGVQAHIFTTLCHDGSEEPLIKVKGSAGELHWTAKSLHSVDSDGTKSELALDENNTDSLVYRMYVNLLSRIDNPDVGLFSSLSSTRLFLSTVNGAVQSTRTVRPVPASCIEEKPFADSSLRHIVGISELIDEAAAKSQLFSELGVSWAQATEPVNLIGYREFMLEQV